MLVSYVEPAQTLINTFHERGKLTNDQVWTLPYVPGGRWSTDKPLYVLTSNETASGAEEFAYDMQQMKRGTVVGTATWGGANPGMVKSLDEHFSIFVPFGSAVNPVSKTNWEGTGVKPDVPVEAADALVAAKNLALRKLLEHASGERRSELEHYLSAKLEH
jgi:C-terminal processing protease CtpA/Prc